MRAQTLVAVAALILAAPPVHAQDILGGILRGAAETAATRLVDRAVDGAVTSATRPAPTPAPNSNAPEPTDSGQATASSPRRPQAGGRNGSVGQEATRLSYMEARGMAPPTGWYVLRPELTREQNCQAMRAAGQWTQDRPSNPCRPR